MQHARSGSTGSRTIWRRLAALAATSALVLAACGGDDDAADDGATSDGPSDASTIPASDDPLAALAAAAALEDGIVWYESLPPEDADEVIAAFNQRFPDVTMDYQQLVGGVDIASRMVQETTAGAPTADVATAAAAQAAELNNRGLLLDLDFDAMGVEREELIASNYAAITSQSLFTIMYNTDLVEADDAPTTWEDLLDPQWRGDIGTWIRGNYLSQMESEWGREQTDEYVSAFMEQSPRVFDSNATLAQALGSGELAIGALVYHPAVATIEAGAPIAVVWPEPVFAASNWTVVNKESQSPNSAMLFVAWLLTDEGNLAYEAATNRGNVFLDNASASLVEGRSIAEWNNPDDLEKDADAIERYSLILERGEMTG